MGKEIKDSGEQADDAKGKFSGFTSVLSGMGTALKAAAAGDGGSSCGAATAIGALTTKAIEGYAAQEQLVGGVETLFKRRLIRLLVMQTTHIKQPECLQMSTWKQLPAFQRRCLPV